MREVPDMASEGIRDRPGFFGRIWENIVGVPPPDPSTNPLLHDRLVGLKGNDAVFAEAERLGRRAQFAMANVYHWSYAAGMMIMNATSLAAAAAHMAARASNTPP